MNQTFTWRLLTPGELTQHLAARPDAAARVWLDHRRLWPGQ